MDIILFGAGDESKNVLPFLEEKFHILFFADNDPKKQGTYVGKYRVGHPDEIGKYSCRVVIASTRYGFEIANQLQQHGISPDRIFFYRKFCTDNRYSQYQLCPVMAEGIEETGKRLIQYDLCHAEERTTASRKVLVFCIFFSTYARQLIENISRRYTDIQFSLLTGSEDYLQRIETGSVEHIYYFRTLADLKTILEQLPVYDAMQLLWIEWEWAYFYRLIRSKTRRLNLNVGGSDFYRACEDEREFRRNLIMCADSIMAGTDETVRNFSGYYGDGVKEKMALLPFGVEVLDWIRQKEGIQRDVLKEKFQLPVDKLVVTCGHNSLESHQHIKMIEALEKLTADMKKQMFFVFPMTYPEGQDAYIAKVRERLARSSLAYMILTKFMDFEEMAEYAMASDVMIHVQTTDQLSSTMLEEMYAGGITIAGEWLPYRSLRDMGMFFLDVRYVSDIGTVLKDVLINRVEYKEKSKANKEIIWRNSSWEEVAPRWRALWE